MKTTVMFVADAIPLGGAPVRLAGGGDDEVYVTDSEGKIDFDLDLGTHTFRVQVDTEWVERTVHREGHAPLYVVNVRQEDARSMTTLNTLQIDLANLVGDRYVFETVLGRGGMGVVVKAIDRMLNRPVAIKMLSDELQDNEEAQQIFLVEARNLATLSHPNLVAIHDILNVGGRVLMVFEYVLGENVEKTIKRKGRLDQKDVLRIAIQLTRCVTYLHEHELIHRDLKPANIIMQADGTLKLIDFGLARSLNELYVRGTRVRGTPAYMAPEQIQGIHLTTGTDIYQIGISMYEMLNGKLPFASGDMAYAHVHLEPPPLDQAVEGLEPELARLVHACLEKQPKNRPASAELLLEQLQQIYARLASGTAESQQFPIFERPHSGSFPGLGQVTSEPGLAHLTSEPEEIEVIEFDDLSFAEEVAGGSNRGLAVMAVLGFVALIVAGWLLTRGGAQETLAQAPDTVTQAEVEPPVLPTAVEEPPNPSQDLQSFAAARGLVSLGLAAAVGQMSTLAFAEPESNASATPQRPRTKTRPSSPAPRSSTAEKAPEPVAQPPAATPEPAAQSVPPLRTQRSTAKPSTNEAQEPKKRGLLSVDDNSTKGLLPVSN